VVTIDAVCYQKEIAPPVVPTTHSFEKPQKSGASLSRELHI
jgi:hypothetical protein